jgi:hypothetical protein
VYPQPFPFEVERDYDVAVRVLRCEGERRADGRTVATLAALIEVTRAGPGGAVVWRQTYTAPELPWDGKDHGALAAALSQGVASLAATVAAELPAK